ncbi:CvpA family protein [Halodesulfovibrio marinisediminis]|uniref:Membrane protein required for colicin V production n=1 Tax=Halodesulfovibrio marinisediminis DSM 17456 TaxID=1121457 RepID=A0A1N6DFT2_9BACT|nr:CvpA family protein [Halodesulfovibrio marinisediminis]SIN69659.1 membrane protein required for colicin V production [Halodesulfovibrio marinisediminis DSM 17456]
MNYLDLLFIVIAGFFCIRGFFRGLILEVTSIAGVVGGFILANNYYEQLAIHLESLIDPKWANVASYALIFIGVLVVAALISALLRKLIGATGAALLDYTLGGVLGGAKGVLLCCIILAFVLHFFPNAEHVKTSIFVPHLRIVTDMLRQFIPDTL